MKTIPGFVHSALALVLTSTALAAIAGGAADLIHAQNSIHNHHHREQATLDAYTCITFALRTHLSQESIEVPHSLYNSHRTLCAIAQLGFEQDSLDLLITTFSSSSPSRTLKVHIPFIEGLPSNAPVIHFE